MSYLIARARGKNRAQNFLIILGCPGRPGAYIVTAIAALKGQFLGHCYLSLVISKGPQTVSGDVLG